MRPAERTLQWCRRHGALAGMTERFNPYAGPVGRDGNCVGIRQDLFGLVDVLALWPKRTDFIQACGVDVAAHITKIRSSVELGARLQSILADHPRRRFFIVGWRKRQLKHQKRPEWVMRIVEALLPTGEFEEIGQERYLASLNEIVMSAAALAPASLDGET